MKQPIAKHLPALVILLAGQAAVAQDAGTAPRPGYKNVPAFDTALHQTKAPRVSRYYAVAVEPAQVDAPVVKVSGHKPKIKLKAFKKPKVKIYKKPKLHKQFYHPAYKHPGHRARKLHLKHKGYRVPHHRYAPKRYRLR